MKRVLILGGVCVLVVVGAVLAYGVWFLRRVVVDDVRVRAALKASAEERIEIEVTTTGSSDGVVITQIDLDRALRDSLGLAPPLGFRMEPLPLEEREKGDKEATDYVAKYNLEKVRYAGRLLVTPTTPGHLTLSAERPRAASGEIRLQHERKVGVGGSIGFVSVRLRTQERAQRAVEH